MESDKQPVKLAYLIVAHYQPEHLTRLIGALNHEGSHFFIHLDAKAHLPSFQDAVRGFDNLAFAPDRVLVEWGKFSVLQAILKVLRMAVLSAGPFRYYTVLSGSDYPIKHKRAIQNCLQSAGRQYIRIDRRLTSAPKNAHSYFIKNLPDGKYFGAMTPYHGSMFWSLTEECIHYVLDFIESNPGYLDIHRHIFAPEEVLFQTIVKHSRFAGMVTQDYSNGIYPDRTHHANHFIDWQGLRVRENLTLDERDFDDLCASQALFARKFDQNKSTKLLALLDAYVHHFEFPQ